MHKIHGDMAIYVTKNSTPVLRPAISQLRDPKCQNIEHEILGGNGIEIAQEVFLYENNLLNLFL